MKQWSAAGGNDLVNFLANHKEITDDYHGNAIGYYNFDGQRVINPTKEALYPVVTVKELEELYFVFPERWCIKGSQELKDIVWSLRKNNEYHPISTSGLNGSNTNDWYMFDEKYFTQGTKNKPATYQEVTIAQLRKHFIKPLPIKEVKEQLETLRNVTTYRVIKEWPGSPSVGKIVLVNASESDAKGHAVNIPVVNTGYVTTVLVRDFQEFLEPVIPPKIPTIGGHKVSITKSSDGSGLTKTTGKFGCVEFDVDWLNDMYGGLAYVFPENGDNKTTGIQIFAAGRNQTITIEQIIEILDYSKTIEISS